MSNFHIVIIKRCKTVVRGRLSLFLNKIENNIFIGYLSEKQKENLKKFIFKNSPLCKLILINTSPLKLQNYDIEMFGYNKKTIKIYDDQIKYISALTCNIG